MYNYLILFLMKILKFIVKLVGKQGGNILGKVAKKLNPNIIQAFKINCPVIAVTATNGKTTTNNAIAYTFQKAGYKVVSNSEGNNMETGIISMFLKNCTLTRKNKSRLYMFRSR